MALSLSHTYTLGVFMPSIEQEMGWSRSQLSAGLTFVAISAVILSPFIGLCIDRFGPRRIALSGIVLYCTAFGAVSLVGPSIYYWWMLWVLVGLAMLLVSPPVLTAAIVTHFWHGRGLAIAVTLCGGGIASASLPIIADTLMSAFGWRGGYLGIALGGGLLAFTLLWLYFYSASDPGMPSPGAAPKSITPVGSLPSWSLRSILISGRFIRMLLAAVLIVAGRSLLDSWAVASGQRAGSPMMAM